VRLICSRDDAVNKDDKQPYGRGGFNRDRRLGRLIRGDTPALRPRFPPGRRPQQAGPPVALYDRALRSCTKRIKRLDTSGREDENSETTNRGLGGRNGEGRGMSLRTVAGSHVGRA
jgi:hypothetical protein